MHTYFIAYSLGLPGKFNNCILEHNTDINTTRSDITDRLISEITLMITDALNKEGIEHSDIAIINIQKLR